jgi:hypothetical protein
MSDYLDGHLQLTTREYIVRPNTIDPLIERFEDYFDNYPDYFEDMPSYFSKEYLQIYNFYNQYRFLNWTQWNRLVIIYYNSGVHDYWINKKSDLERC